MAMCKVRESAFYGFMSALRVNNMAFFKTSPFLANLAGKQYALMETGASDLGRSVTGWRNVLERFAKNDKSTEEGVMKFSDFTGRMNDVISDLASISKLERDELLYAKDVEPFTYRLLRKAEGEKADWPGARKDEGIIEAAFKMGDGKVDEAEALEFASVLRDTLRTFDENGYDLDALFRTLNHGDFVENLLSVTQGGFKVAMAEHVGKNLEPGAEYKVGSDYSNMISDFKKSLKENFGTENVKFTEKEVDRLVNDLLGKSLHTGWMKKANAVVNEFRGLYNVIQLSPLGLLYGATAGALFLAQSFIVGIPHAIARSLSSDYLNQHKVIDDLIRKHKVLFSEKVADVDFAVFEDAYQMYSYKAMNRIVNNWFTKNVIPESWRQIILTLSHGGIHNAFDMYLEASAKKRAIAQALGSLGITPRNADEFSKLLESGKINLDSIRTSAHAYYANFRTASDTLAMSRNIFSKLFFWNVRAGYLINRGAEVQFALERLAKDVSDGNVTSVGDFVRHMDRNEELRTVVLTALVSAKYAAVADRFFDDMSTEDSKSERVVEMWNGMNDYYAALTQNLPIRTLMGPIGDTVQYSRFMDSHGKEVTAGRLVGSWAWNQVNEVLRGFFKEAKVLDPLMQGTAAYVQGYDGKVIMESIATQWKALASSSTRFSLLESDAPYDLRKVRENTDFFQTILMGVNDSNEFMKRYDDLRNVENVEKFFQDPGYALKSMLFNINSLPKWAVGVFQGSKTGEVLNELRNEMASEDSVMRNLYNGKWDPRLMDGENYDRFFSSFYKLDLASMGLGEDGLKAVNKNYGLDVAKKEAFEIGMLKLVDKEDLMKRITEAYDSGEDRAAGLIEIMAFADSKVPGSSRLMLSHAANQYYSKLNQAYHRDVRKNPKWEYEFGDNGIPPALIEANKKKVVNAFYPSMFIADKQTWSEAMFERVQQKYPSLLKWDDKKNKQFFSALTLMDLMAYGEAKEGNPNANYVKNVMAMVGKYVDDPAMRMLLANRAMDSIDATSVSPDVAATAKLGFVAANVEIVDKMLGDPEMVAKHGKALEESMNKIFGNEKHINEIGSRLIGEQLNDMDAKKYSGSSGKPYYPSRYGSANGKVKSGIESKIPGMLSRFPASYSPSNVSRYDHDPFQRFSAFSPRMQDANGNPGSFYAQVYLRMLAKAESRALVTGYVNRFPGDTEKDDKFRLTAKAPKVPLQKKQTFNPKRARYMFKTSPFEG